MSNGGKVTDAPQATMPVTPSKEGAKVRPRDVELHLEKAQLEALFDGAQEAIVMTENDGRILRTNEEFTRMFGYAEKEIVGHFIDDLVAPHHGHDEAQEITRRVARSERIALEAIRYRKDGTPIPVSILGAPVVVDGKQVGVFGIYRDITDRREAEEALKRKSRQQERLLQTARHLTESLEVKEVLTRIARGAKEIINAHGCSLYLLEGDDSTLTPVVSIDPQYEQEILSTPLTVDGSFTGKAVRSRRALVFNDPQSDPSGKQIPGTPVEFEEKIVVAPLIADDKVLGAMCLDRMKVPFTEEDLALAETFATYAATALKNAQTYDELQREVRQRRRMEKKLKRIMAELKRSNDELQQFAYVASHDLQEPLRMVASYVQLLSKRYRGQLDRDADDFIGYAVDGATRMQGLINDLLAYSRVGTRGRPFEPTDLNEIFERAVTNLQAAVVETQAHIDHDPLPTLMVDRLQFTQLFQNLIGNAIKFHDDQPPRVHVAVEKKGEEYILSVSDNGIGIDPEYADRIFMIFQRLHNRSEYKGTGIGLAICKKIVERHGGRIWVESKPKQGATFYFTIPLKGGQSS
jgi:PAS domain S-box-containing protein